MLATIKCQIATATSVFRSPERCLFRKQAPSFKPYISEALKVRYTANEYRKTITPLGKRRYFKRKSGKETKSSDWKSGKPPCSAKTALLKLLDFKNGVGWKWITWQGKELGAGGGAG